jgi:peptidoglycan/LPS O-acetylase OafA/YrhL
MNDKDFNKNNLDCFRLILASTVALFHIYALTGIAAFSAFDKYLSPHFAVRGFFVISGMLIYRSYIRSSSVHSYLEKRIRRIYPAYFTIVTTVAITLFTITVAPWSHYFGIGFWKYLAANLVFLNFLAPSLPGVFDSHLNSAVNGALWTLKIEVAFYLLVPLIHNLCRRFGTKRIIGLIFILSCLWKYGFRLLDSLYSSHGLFASGASRTLYGQLEVQFPAQLAYFCAGILLLLYYDRLKAYFIPVACITALLYLIDHFITGEILDLFWISGIVFVFGFWRFFGNFSKYGDFSYGVYIVHWPVLQTLIALGFAEVSPVIFLIISLASIGLAAFLMWHLVEKRFLSSSSHYREASLKRCPKVPISV